MKTLSRNQDKSNVKEAVESHCWLYPETDMTLKKTKNIPYILTQARQLSIYYV